MEYYWRIEQSSFFSLDTFTTIFSSKLNNLIPIFHPSIFWLFFIINTSLLIFSKNKKNIHFIFFPIIITIFASFIHQYPFNERLLLFLLPIIILLYCQLFNLLKENKNLTILSLFLVLVFTFNSLKIDYKKDFNDKNWTRKAYIKLKKSNPNLENIISDEVVYEYYSNSQPLFSDLMFGEFKNSKFVFSL